MRAITLWQPWATLVAIGAKEYETRSWKTSYRGPLAIHAALTTKHINLARQNESMQTALLDAGYLITEQIPFGAVIAVVELVDCFPVEQIWHQLSEEEADFGDYGAGRYAWELRLIREVKPYVPVRGRQGIWHWRPEK